MDVNKWDELIDKARNGLITPEEAEVEAVRAGLLPLAYTPNAADYDPLRETWWTLPMAVAWISRRQADAVRDVWEDYTNQCRHWIFREWRVGFEGPTTKGFSLEYRSRPRFLDLIVSDKLRVAGGEAAEMSFAAAKEALWVALREGFFEATGIASDSDKRVAIPPMEWRDLEAAEVHGVDLIAAGQTSYRDVCVQSRSVVGFWPQAPVVTSAADLPLITPPGDAGYMPLYCAAQWIATKGNRETIDPLDPSVWQAAYAELLGRIASEDVKVIGAREGQREPIPGYHFAGCRVDYPHIESPMELMVSEELHLRSYPFAGEKPWFDGFDDALKSRREVRWNRIQVHQPDIRRLWPFGQDDLPPISSDRTGAPGRPTSMHLIRAEFAARQARGETAPNLSAEASALVDWLGRTHGHLPRPSKKTVMNGLRDVYRARSAQK